MENLWRKKVIEVLLFCCEPDSELAKGGHEVRGTSSRRTESIVEADSGAAVGGDRGVHILWHSRSSHPRCLARQGEAPRSWTQRRCSLEQCPQITPARKRDGEGGVKGSTVRTRGGGRESLTAGTGFRSGGKHLDLFEGVALRGAAPDRGLRPLLATGGVSNPSAAQRLVTRVLER